MGKREGDEKNRDGDQVWGDGGGRRLGVRSVAPLTFDP